MARDRLMAAALAALAAFALFGFVLHAQSAQQTAPANSIGMAFAGIPAGEFMMGCSAGDERCEADETPRHRVRITRSFEIGKYEVTQSQWVAVMGSNPSSNKGDALPVETVSKLEAQEFLAKLNAGNDGYAYRLPTEAEWEYAARAGMDAPYSGPLDQVAWYAGNSEDETHRVGLKKPNAWGVYDVQGNVREWVSDLYSATYYSMSPADDPAGPDSSGYAASVPGRGGPLRGGRGGPPQGGRGGGPGFPGPNIAPPPQIELIPFPAGGSQQDQIDALRRQIEQLQREVQQLRNTLAGTPFPQGPLLGGILGNPPPGPAVEVRPGVLVDPIDGLLTGLPVVRGGGWDQSAGFQRVSARYTYYGPTLRVSDIGFRVVRTPVLPSR